MKPWFRRRPCDSCPFIRGAKAIRLTRERVDEIAGMMLSSAGGTFPCHKTTTHGDEDDEDGSDTFVERDKEQQCAGALIFAEKHDTATQAMRIAERIGFYDRRQLRGQEMVFDSVDEMRATAFDRRRR
jgi:hypothetical protein